MIAGTPPGGRGEGRSCAHGGVDVQRTLIRGTPSEVKQEVRDLVAVLGGSGGGYIGGTSHTVMPETPLDNVIAMYEAFLECRDLSR
jgi:uroporphyrinogen-III decarboxylase